MCAVVRARLLPRAARRSRRCLTGTLQDPNVILLSAILGAAQSFDAPGSESTLDASFGLALAAASAIFLAVVSGDPNVEGAVKRVRGWLGQASK